MGREGKNILMGAQPNNIYPNFEVNFFALFMDDCAKLLLFLSDFLFGLHQMT